MAANQASAASRPGLQTIPERLGRYRIVRPLSKGGMALVYEARRENELGVSTPVAVKVILPDYANSKTFKDLFINEARLGAAMHHQNLVQIQDFDAEGDLWFLVMEYVEGHTLSRLAHQAHKHDVPVPMGVLCEIGRQVCDGLHYAHEAVDGQGRPLGLIHRDIKPSNLILGPEGGVKILDFGISKGRLRREREGSVKGTWGYMAPEQALGQRMAPNADVFALGIVLYELAARKPLFKGRKEDEIKDLLEADHAARAASTLDAAYAPLVGVLHKALQRDPRARYPSAADFGRALSELLPDPITSRQEVVHFYEEMDSLYAADKARRLAARGAQGADAAEADAVRPRTALQRAAARRTTMAASAFAGMAVVVGAFLLGYAVLRATAVWEPGMEPGVDPLLDPVVAEGLPPDPADPPDEGATPPPVAPSDAAAAAPPDDAAGRPTRPDATGLAWMTLGADESVEIYLDGKLYSGPVGERAAFTPGKHLITMFARDGRKISFEVDLSPGAHLRRVWDFEAWTWR